VNIRQNFGNVYGIEDLEEASKAAYRRFMEKLETW